MEQKKPTKAQIERRLQNAVVLVEKTTNTKSIVLADKGLRLTVTDDYAVVETLSHRHVFDRISLSGLSRPYLYIDRLIDIANSNDCKTENGYSFAKLLDVLKAKEDQSEYNIVVFTEWWMFNCFQPLFSIGETEAETFLVYESYLHNLARNQFLLEPRNEDVTNKQFVDAIIANMKSFTEDLNVRVVFPKKTDKDIIKENIDAIAEQQMNDAMEAQV